MEVDLLQRLATRLEIQLFQPVILVFIALLRAVEKNAKPAQPRDSLNSPPPSADEPANPGLTPVTWMGFRREGGIFLGFAKAKRRVRPARSSP